MSLLSRLRAAIDAFRTHEPQAADKVTRNGVNPPFRGAQITRNNRGWQPGLTSGDDALAVSNPLLHTRTRDMVQNEPSCVSARRKMTTHVIGTGMQSFADAHVGDEVDEEYCDETDLWWQRYIESREWDVEGKLSFNEGQARAFGEEMLGDCFLLECWDPNPRRSSPLCYQLLEAEQIDTSKDRPAGDGLNRIVRGVELDRFNRAVAYYVYDAHPYDSSSGWTSSSTRITAERMLHSFVGFRPSATRGLNWFAVILQAARDGDTVFDNELTAGILASMFVVAINRANGAGTGVGLDGIDEEGTDAQGRPLTRLGKGIIADLGPEDKITQIQSNRPSPLLAALMKLIRQQIAMGIGISELRLTGDYSQSSYTSARGAHLDDQAVFEPIQEHFAKGIVLPTRQRHNDIAVGLGRIKSITARQYEQDLYRWRCFEVFPVGREQLDPEMETEAAAARIRTGISTLKEECAARGYHWRALLRQRKYEQETIARMGLESVINFSKGGGAPDAPNNDPQPAGRTETKQQRRQRLDGKPTPADSQEDTHAA